MPNVAAVRLTYNPRVLWFDPNGIEFSAGDALIVKTERGLEYGVADENLKEVSEDAIAKLKSPLKPVMRKATSEDSAKWANLQAQAEEALPVFKEMVEQYKLDMHPVTVEFLFDGDKAIFYFEADERIDFRELVRALAAKFHVRIDMRQIGVRDEARIVGGFGHCGQELCCARLGGEFCPVSIRMAKEQDLSLNPQKISGVCGRLMCCLRYEFDAYKDFKSRAPKQNATVKTPDGPAKVIDLDVPREVVSVRLEGEKPVRVPLSAFDAPEEGSRPNTIGQEAWDEANAPDEPEFMSNALFSTDQFTGRDKLAEAGSVRRTGSSKRSRKGGSGERPAEEPHRARRRRSTKVSAESDHASKQDSQEKKQDKQSSRSSSSKRKPRRRSDQKAGEAKQGKQSSERSAKHQKPQRAKEEGKGQQKSGPRPGQKSSGLRAKPQKQASSSGSRQQGEGGQRPAQGGAPSQNEHRRARRRSHKAGGSSQNEG